MVLGSALTLSLFWKSGLPLVFAPTFSSGGRPLSSAAPSAAPHLTDAESAWDSAGPSVPEPGAAL